MPSAMVPLTFKRASGATLMMGLTSETAKLPTSLGSRFRAPSISSIRAVSSDTQVMLPVVKLALPSQTVSVKVPPLTPGLKVSVSTSLRPAAAEPTVVCVTSAVGVVPVRLNTPAPLMKFALIGSAGMA